MENKIEVDIIILSYAYTKELQIMTQECIDSLVASEDASKIRLNIYVIESQKNLKNYQYPSTQTIYPKQAFGFHRYMNIGIKISNSPYVCLCNNDLIFHKEWASEILMAMKQYPDLVSASPICSILQPHIGFSLNSDIKIGYRIGYEVAGWCLFVKRIIFKTIGELDENYTFAGADHDYANTLMMLNFKHALITSSIVDHYPNSKTLSSQSEDIQNRLTKEINYNVKKWSHRILPFNAI